MQVKETQYDTDIKFRDLGVQNESLSVRDGGGGGWSRSGVGREGEENWMKQAGGVRERDRGMGRQRMDRPLPPLERDTSPLPERDTPSESAQVEAEVQRLRELILGLNSELASARSRGAGAHFS